MTKDARAASFVPSACSVLCFTHRNGNHRTSYLRYCLQPSQASKMGGGGLKPQGLTRVKRVLQATALADRQGEDGDPLRPCSCRKPLNLDAVRPFLRAPEVVGCLHAEPGFRRRAESLGQANGHLD